MKKILIIGLTVLILFIVACQPTPPPPPGFSEFSPVGKATEAIGSTPVADGGDVFMITDPEDKIFLLGPNEDGTLKVETSGVETDDFVWGGFYTCPKGCDPDNIMTYTGHQVTGNFYDDVWTKGSDVYAELTINRANYNLGENIVIGYVCKLIEKGLFSSTWDCNGDGEADDDENPPALLADYFKLYPSCEDTDNGNEKNVKGIVTGIDVGNTIYDAESETCQTDTSVNEMYCQLPMDPNGECITTSTCEMGLSGKVCTYNYGSLSLKSSTPCSTASECYYCSNSPTTCASDADCTLDIFPQVIKTTLNCDLGDVCFDGACYDVPFYNQNAPSKTGAVTAEKVTAPSIIQLNTEEEIELEISTDHDIIFSTFNFGEDVDFDETEAVSFSSSTQNYGSCVTLGGGICQTINVGWGSSGKGCGGSFLSPCQTNADCKKCSLVSIPCTSNTDCSVTSGADGGWIMASASKTITFNPYPLEWVIEEEIKEDGLELGANFLYVYGCDKASTGWNCHDQKWTKKPVIIVPPCIDSDEGVDQTVQGTIYGMTEDGASFIVEESSDYTDSCVSTGVGQSVVKEFYCEARTDNIVVIKSQNINCEEDETCFLGKCEPYEVPPETI